MNSKIFLATFAFLAVTLPALASAGPIIRSGETVSVDASQVLEGDFYALSPSVTLSGKGDHDAYIGGGTITVNAPIAKDLTVIGGVVQIHGDIGDDVRIVGGEVTIASGVKGDVVVLAGTLTILSTGHIDGGVIFMGSSLTIEGDVQGNIQATAETARINSDIGGNVVLNVGPLFTVGDNARVVGDISYTSNNDLVRAQEAEILGTIQKKDVTLDPTTSNFFDVYLFELGIILFTAFVLFFVFRKKIETIFESAHRGIGIAGFIGLGVFIVVPFVVLLLMVSLIGILVGVFLALVYLALLVLSAALSGILVGLYIEKKILKKEELSPRAIILGVLSVTLVGFIPYIGGMILFALLIITLGTISQFLYHAIKS